MNKEKVQVIGFSEESTRRMEFIVSKSEDAPLKTEKDWFDRFLKDFCGGKEDDRQIKDRPSPRPWMVEYIFSINFERERGEEFASRLREEFLKNASDSFSSTQQVILENCNGRTKKHLQVQIRECGEDENIEPFYEQKSVLQFAVLASGDSLVKYLVENVPQEDRVKWINNRDFITGFTVNPKKSNHFFYQK